MNYLDWNNAIAAHFFSPPMAHRPVYLYVTQDLIGQLGKSNGKGISDFISCVQAGPPWITDGRLSICGKAHRTFELWRANGAETAEGYPPYVAYLALFVLAAGVDGDFAAHAYYPRLHSLLGEDEHAGSPRAFDRMWELWLDLEEWSKSDRNEELGIFHFVISGDWQHVGLPIAQTLLSESDRQNLPRLFSEYALDPASPVTELELLALLRVRAEGILQRRTRRLLDAADTPARRAFLAAVVSELEHWDGTLRSAATEASPGVAAVLRLCCWFDETAGTTQMRLRCKASVEYPDTDLTLAQAGGSLTLVAEEHGLGWSTELVEAQHYAPFDASSVDWNAPLQLRDTTHGWQATMQPSSVRVFENGPALSLPNYVEASRIGRDSEYLVAACDHVDRIQEWGARECEEFTPLRITSGLPPGWRMFRIRGAKTDALVRDVVPRLALPSSIRIQFCGGITVKDGSSTRFFAFAQPAVHVEGPAEGVIASCNGERLAPRRESSAEYALPARAPLNETLRIEAVAPSGDRTSNSLQLVNVVFPDWRKIEARFGPFGQRLPSDSKGALGSLIDGESSFPAFDFARALPLIDAKCAYLIGPAPGQVSRWPSEKAPTWTPVWAVLKNNRKGEVLPCMVDLATAGPHLDHADVRSRVQLWKNVVSLSKKKFLPPKDPKFAALWDEYQKAARNV